MVYMVVILLPILRIVAPDTAGNTHYYADGWRQSWDTSDGIHEKKKHWTNQNIPKGKRNKGKRHNKPDDAK